MASWQWQQPSVQTGWEVHTSLYSIFPPLLLVMIPPFLSLTTITFLPLINQAISVDGPASGNRARFPGILNRFTTNTTLVYLPLEDLQLP